MSAFSGGAASNARCALCGATGAVWDVWGVLLCPTHHANWLADERFSVEAVNGALGLSSAPEEFTPAGHARYCAEAERRTKAWVTEQAKARAA